MTARFIIPAFCALFVGVSAFAQEPQGDVERGRRVAAQQCASCHSIGRVGLSPMRKAPPFRRLHQKYEVEGLAEALAEGIGVGDPVMPEHVLEAEEIDHLIAYLKDLEPREAPQVAAGRRLANRHCGSCHAVESGRSRLEDAPPFRDLPARFRLDRFTEAYRDGIFEGHARMPLVELDPDELAELSAYLRSVQDASGRRPR